MNSDSPFHSHVNIIVQPDKSKPPRWAPVTSYYNNNGWHVTLDIGSAAHPEIKFGEFAITHAITGRLVCSSDDIDLLKCLCDILPVLGEDATKDDRRKIRNMLVPFVQRNFIGF